MGAKQNVTPVRCRHSAAAAGSRSTTTPSSSSRSADPQAEDADRLPCLTTRAPVPATTIADIVEMFTVLARSPPVPQVSTAGPSTVNRAATSSIARTRPVTSSGDSPLARSATTNPATWVGVASPSITCSMAHAVSVLVRSVPDSNVVSSPGQVGAVAGPPGPVVTSGS